MQSLPLAPLRHRADGCKCPKNPTVEILSSGTTGTPRLVPFPYQMIYKDIVNPVASPLSPIDGDKIPPDVLYFPLSNVSGFVASYRPC